MDINQKLIEASDRGFITDVENCIKNGADVNTVDEYGETPLMKSVYSNHKIIKALIKNGADLDKQDGDGYTALMLASIYDNVRSVKILIDTGANVNIRDKFGCNALDMAFHQDEGGLEVAKALIKAGADTSYSYEEHKEYIDQINTDIAKEQQGSKLLNRYRKRKHLGVKP